MSESVRQIAQDGVSVLTMDDGKVNAMSSKMLAALGAAIDRAEADGNSVVITGRDGVFSAGFDLSTLRQGGEGALAMLEAGARLAVRLLAFPAPVVAAVSGHAMAMGAFVALGADVRIGTLDDDHQIAANEVAIGLTLPHFAVEMLRWRLAPAAFDRAALTAQPYTGAQAVHAGWLDERTPKGSLLEHAIGRAKALAAFDRHAFQATKQRVRSHALEALRACIEADIADWQRLLTSSRA